MLGDSLLHKERIRGQGSSIWTLGKISQKSRNYSILTKINKSVLTFDCEFFIFFFKCPFGNIKLQIKNFPCWI
jgi:hypothetical protein